jgi:hypothetical protein
LLSCGIENSQKSASGLSRKVKPISNTTCQCYDEFAMNCVAWCTTLPISTFEIKTKMGAGFSSVGCSSGKQPLGCHISPTASSTEQWRQYFPISSNNSCSCYDYFGTDCVASCGAIMNYEVNSAYAAGTITVSCSNPNNKVLGCGINPKSSPGVDRFRTVKVASEISCQCFDSYGTYCYAICGKIW